MCWVTLNSGCKAIPCFNLGLATIETNRDPSPSTTRIL